MGKSVRISSSGIMVPSGYNLVSIHAVRMLTGGPANETVCCKEAAQVQADIDWEDLKANTVQAPRCESCKTETGFGR
jgi:hypothetical protein